MYPVCTSSFYCLIHHLSLSKQNRPLKNICNSLFCSLRMSNMRVSVPEFDYALSTNTLSIPDQLDIYYLLASASSSAEISANYYGQHPFKGWRNNFASRPRAVTRWSAAIETKSHGRRRGRRVMLLASVANVTGGAFVSDNQETHELVRMFK